MESALSEMFRQNLWANLRLLDACEGLSEDQMDASAPGTYGTVRDTLAHIVRSEEAYVAMMTDDWPERLPQPSAEFPGLAALRERSRASGEALVELAGSLPPERILRGSWRGQPYAVRAGYVLVQAVNHATEHRAHVAVIVSQQGAAVPELDGWAYARQREGGDGH